METIEFKLKRCLNNIEDWATEIGFKFSKTKTQCVHFCQIRQLHLDPHLTITIHMFVKMDYGSIVYGSARNS